MQNPTLVGPVSPTPPVVYEPRIWAVRIWLKGGPFAGTGFFFKAPYGQAMNAATVLARAASRFQISRFTFGPASVSQLRDGRVDRKKLQRFDEAFGEIGRTLQIDWEA